MAEVTALRGGGSHRIALSAVAESVNALSRGTDLNERLKPRWRPEESLAADERADCAPEAFATSISMSTMTHYFFWELSDLTEPRLVQSEPF